MPYKDPEKRREYRNRYYKTYRKDDEEYLVRRRRWGKAYREKHKAEIAARRSANPKERARIVAYRAQNRVRLLEYNRVYSLENREKIQERRRQRYHTEISVRLLAISRARIVEALRRGGYKSTKTIELLGCTIDRLRAHLESRFQPGMTWENYGQWQVDHIRPCASFDLTDPEQQRQCFRHTNLQPLWARDNLKKSDTWIGDQDSIG